MSQPSGSHLHSTTKLPDPIYNQTLNTIWNDAGAWADFISAMHRSIIPNQISPKTPEETSQIEWLKLPTLCCRAAGGNRRLARPVSLAWGLLYTAAHLMDSVADQDELPDWMAEAGSGSTINIATGLYASSILALNNLLEKGVAPEIVARIQDSFNRSILQMCSGQHLDLSASFKDLDTCWRIAEAKSGTMFELACRSGAQLGTDDEKLISTLGEYGKHLGMMVQICDDVSELWANRDFDQRKFNFYSIPIAYTMEVLHDDDRERFRDYIERMDDPHSAERACEIVEKAGAVLYTETMFRYHSRLALKAITAACANAPVFRRLVNYVELLSAQV